MTRDPSWRMIPASARPGGERADDAALAGGAAAAWETGR